MSATSFVVGPMKKVIDRYVNKNVIKKNWQVVRSELISHTAWTHVESVDMCREAKIKRDTKTFFFLLYSVMKYICRIFFSVI